MRRVQIVVDEQAGHAVNGGVEHGHLLESREQLVAGRTVLPVKFIRHDGQAEAEAGGDSGLVSGVFEMPPDRGGQLPAGVLEHGGNLLKRKAEAA